VGTAGVLPRIPCLGKDLGGHGGNIDFKRFGVGAILWLAAQTPGGNVFVGDVHAAMGDGEVCGTGVEISASVDVRLSALALWSPRLPTVTVEGGAWLIGIGDSLEDALRRAVREAVRLVSEKKECSVADAYLAVSSLLIVELCQVVNSSSSVAVTLSGGLSGLLGPDFGAQTTISRDEA
jgi:amidase